MHETLLAGAARRDISPDKPMFLCGYPHAERTSTGIHDPLLATALCLQAGEQRLITVAVDNLFVNPWVARQWRSAVSAATGVDEAGIFISTSHTHSGPHTADVLEWGPSPVVPPVDPDYLARLQAGIVAAAAEAAANLRPAELAWTSAMIDGVGGNRHDPEHGARDPEAGLLVVREAGGGDLIALAIVYAMHPTVMHEDSRLVSADFPGMARRRLQALIGRELPILYHTGPAGNQSPRYHVKAQTFAECERLGNRLADQLWPAIQSLSDAAFERAPVLAGGLRQVALPWRQLPSVAEATAINDAYQATFRRLQANGAPKAEVRTAECDKFGAEETVYLATCQEDGTFQAMMERYDPLEVQVVRIGASCLVGYPGELFVEYGLMTRWQASRRAFAVNLVNGETQGYVVTEAAIREGRYETHNRAFAAAAGPIMVEAALGLIRDLG